MSASIPAERSQFLDRLAAIVGNDAIDGEPPRSDDVPLEAAVAPAEVVQVGELVRVATAESKPIYPFGGRTMLEFGNAGTRPGIGLDTSRLDRTIDYPSRDMTITVQAGIRVARLAEILAAEGQRLPVDVPRSVEATLGGAIAVNSSGPRRYGFGTLRDYVIGISVVDADGNETKAGGRVVKNVAGYDLCKLYVGSFGSLGIITQVTLKLRPLPESNALVWHTLADATQAATALERLVTSRTRPVAIELLNRLAAEHVAHVIGKPLPCSPWVLVVGFEENREAVSWQLEALGAELGNLAAWSQSFRDAESEPLWRSLIEFPGLEPVTFKANLRSSGVTEFLDEAGRQPIDWHVQAHAGSGIVRGSLESRATDVQSVISSLAKLRALAVSLGGNLVLPRCPADWKSHLPVWGEPRGDYWLMQSLKRKLDPHGLFNPGRFVE